MLTTCKRISYLHELGTWLVKLYQCCAFTHPQRVPKASWSCHPATSGPFSRWKPFLEPRGLSPSRRPWLLFSGAAAAWSLMLLFDPFLSLCCRAVTNVGKRYLRSTYAEPVLPGYLTFVASDWRLQHVASTSSWSHSVLLAAVEGFRFPALLICCHSEAQTSGVVGARTSKSIFTSLNSIVNSPIIFQWSYPIVR